MSADTNCPKDAQIRGEMMLANYAGDWRQVRKLTGDLAAHHKACPVCNGTIYNALFSKTGARVVVR